MSDRGVYRNFEALEGTVTTETTLDLVRKSRKLVITNDHSSNDLSYKFNSSETYGTLKPAETLSMHFIADQIILNGTNVPYRVWVYG